ncbi:MAG: squalene/phytoene synthase family protein [Phycisphaerales bacterium]
MPAPDPGTWGALLEGCAASVAPAVEELCDGGVSDPDTLKACGSALVAALLTNLWRDVRVDVMANGRVYIPRDLARKHGLDLSLMRKSLMLDTDRGCEGDARDGSCNCANSPNTGLRVVLPAYRETMHELVHRTRMFWDEANPKPDLLPETLRQPMKRMRDEALALMRKIESKRYDTLTRRPTLGALDRAWMGIRGYLPL